MISSPIERDDAALVEAALSGEDRAFTELMRRHKAPIYRFVRRYVGDPDEAYDLVQETFVAAWAALSGFDASRPMPAWLRRIALNKCRDWGRRRQVRQFFYFAANLETPAAQAITAVESEEPSSAEADLLRLDAAIAKLPPALKEPLILTAFEGLSQRDAADALGLSVKAVETRIYRARKILERLIIESDDVSES